MTTLFDSAQLGDLTLRNRVIMAPLTRCRASGACSKCADGAVLPATRQRGFDFDRSHVRHANGRWLP